MSIDLDDIIHMPENELRAYVEENVSYYANNLPVIVCDNSEEYAIAYDDDKANMACRDEIRERVWAFNPDFLAEQTELPVEVFEALLKSNLCEGANEAVLALIEHTGDFEDFCETAIDADGRGHFLSWYDGEEIELASGGYAYRVQ